MAASDLPQHLIDAGRKLLDALDAAGLQPQGAAWIFDHVMEDWKYIVATSLVETMGRSGVYKRLLKVMEKLDMPKELTMADVHLVSLESPLFTVLAKVVRIDRGGHVILKDCMINNAKVDAVIYRWTEAPNAAEAVRIERQFKRRAKELAG